MRISVTRRGFIAGAGAAALAASGAGAAALPPGPYSAVLVDVSHLKALGLGHAAEGLRLALTQEARREFADWIGPTGPRLIIRVTGLSLSSYAGSSSRWGGGRGGATNTDYLDGVALVVGRSGQVIAQHPQLSALPSSSGGAWYDPASEPRRIEALARHYASWLRRAAGG